MNPNVCIDGQRVEFDGLSLLNIGRTTRPKGGAADIWVVHVPPSKTIVATRSNGRDNGDPELVSAVRRYAPRMVLSGHIHTPIHWREQSDSTLYLNPGRSPDAAFPNYILISTELMSGKLYTAQRHEASIEAAAIRAPDEEACVTTAVA